MIGIIGYGAYVPRYRIKVEEIAKVWGQDPETIKKSIRLHEKSVPSPDQDMTTIAVEAAKSALKRAGINPAEIGCVYVGSESKPYAVKPSSVIIAEAIGATPEVHCADFEFACKGGSECIFVAYGLTKAGLVKYGMGIGSDTSQGAPGDALEFTAAAGGAAYIMGSDEDKIVAEVEETFSFATDTADFWRRDGQYYPLHGGRFTGEPAYFKHVTGATEGILAKTGLKPSDFKYAVFHMPNTTFPLRASRRLGFTAEQMEPGLVVKTIGNCYSGSSPLGVSAVLDIAKAGDRILWVSFGSGAGSDAFVLKATKRLEEVQGLAPTFAEMAASKEYLDYGTYAKFRGKIRMAE